MLNAIFSRFVQIDQYINQDFYDHPFRDDCVSSIANMKIEIDEDFVRDRLMNVEFCKFVYDYAAFVRFTAREFREKMSDASSEAVKNLFVVLTPSDIAWAMLVYVSNENRWKWEIQEYYKKKNTDIVHKDGSGNKIEYEKTSGLWKARGTIKQGSVGYTDDGRVFYSTLKNALKKVPALEWDDIWGQYWSSLQTKPTSARRPRKGQANRWEKVADDAISEELDDSIDPTNDDVGE